MLVGYAYATFDGVVRPLRAVQLYQCDSADFWKLFKNLTRKSAGANAVRAFYVKTQDGRTFTWSRPHPMYENCDMKCLMKLWRDVTDRRK